jgi:hypothetical protein
MPIEAGVRADGELGVIRSREDLAVALAETFLGNAGAARHPENDELVAALVVGKLAHPGSGHERPAPVRERNGGWMG